jgi:hypothetical protein
MATAPGASRTRRSTPPTPYELHPGDHVQVRRTIAQPDHGQLRNGTGAVVADVDTQARELDLQLADGTQIRLTEQQLAGADLRLAYVQHPFPAQGQTTDTAHLIVTGQVTREGTYVAVTRARDQTHIYAAGPSDRPPGVDRLEDLAERLGRTEPEVPSIRTQLAHEDRIRDRADLSRTNDPLERVTQDITDVDSPTPRQQISREVERQPSSEPSIGHHRPHPGDPEQVATEYPGMVEERRLEPDPGAILDGSDDIPERPAGSWPRRHGREPTNAQRAVEPVERDQTLGWEP